MGTIAEKLSYLADTKDLFKDRLNSLGSEITSSTTFRNYLTWLDTFYEEVSDKTDLSQNGVVGRTSQETTSGINVYNVNSHYVLSDGYSINDEDWLTNTYDNSQGVEHYENIWCRATSLLETSTNYLIVCEIKSISGSGILYPYTKHSTSAIDTQHSSYSFSSLSPGQKILIPVTTKSSFSGLSCDLRTLVRYNEGQSGSITFRLSLLTDTSITSDTFVYESFTNGPSPNPDYPQLINNLSGDVDYTIKNKNKLKLANQDITINGVNFKVLSNGKMLINGNATASIDGTLFTNDNYFPVDLDSGTYTLSRSETNSNVSIGLCTTNGLTSIATLSRLEQNKGTAFTLNQKAYLFFYIPSGSVIDNYEVELQLEKGSTATSYEPYIEPQTFNIPLKSKNLFDVEYETRTQYSTNGSIVTSKYTLNNNQISISESNAQYGRYFFNKLLLDVGTYTLSWVPSLSGTDKRMNYSVRNLDNSNDIVINTRMDMVDNEKYSIAFTLNEKQYVTFSLQPATNDGGTLTLKNIQLEKNSTATSYEPYYDIELCDIDTYEDKIYSSDGRFYLRKENGKYTFNSIVNAGLNTSGETSYQAQIGIIPTMKSSNWDYGYSNYFKRGTSKSNNIIRFGANDKYIYIYTNDSTFSITSSANTWISSHNIICYYILDTPTTTEITQENYPSLYNALKQIQDYLTAYKINKEFILGYSSPEIEY